VQSPRAEVLLRRLAAKLSTAPPAALLAGLFFFALAIRLIYLSEVSDTAFFKYPVGDSITYDRWALDIQKDWVGKEVFYQAPLFPYFLAVVYKVFGHSLWAVRLVQAMLGSAACVLLALAARPFFSRLVAALSGGLLAVYGPAIFFDGLIHKASLDAFFMAALLFFISRVESERTRRWPALGTGVVLGALALTRENALLLIPVLALWMGWRFWAGRVDRVLAERIALFGLGVALVLGPVAARNYAVGGEVFVTTSQSGANFFIGNNELSDGTYNPLRWGNAEYPLERADAFQMAADALGHPVTPRQVSRYWTSRALGWIRSHPGDWLMLLARKWMLVWNAREIPDSDEPIVYQDASVELLWLGRVFSFATIGPLAFAGLVATWSDRRRLSVLYLVVLGIAVSTALFFVCARYRYPMVPVLLLFAAAGIHEIGRRARERRGRSLAVYGGVVGVAALAIGWDLGAPGSSRDMAYYNLAVSLERQGDTASAATSYQAALAENADFEQAHVNLGGLLASRGDFEGGISHERAALKLQPDDAIAHTDLANALLELGQLDEAERHFRAALAIQPGLAEAQDGLAAVSEAIHLRLTQASRARLGEPR
jgi:4-amino-4-deoxy-L-arabinose transferase-like glycosyltransferase